MTLIINGPLPALVLSKHGLDFTLAKGVHMMRGVLHTFVPGDMLCAVKKCQFGKLRSDTISLNLVLRRLSIVQVCESIFYTCQWIQIQQA